MKIQSINRGSTKMIKTFTSPTDGAKFQYRFENGNLTYKFEGTDWQDFIIEDKRAYANYEYAEFLSLCDN